MNFRRVSCWFIMSLFLLSGFCFWRAHRPFGLPRFSSHRPMPAKTITNSASVPLIPSQIQRAPDQDAGTASIELVAEWARSIPEAKFAQFAKWAEGYVRAPGPDRLLLEAEGVELARQRGDEMSDLIQSHPERSLQLAVPFSVRQRLPGSVTALLEKQV